MGIQFENPDLYTDDLHVCHILIKSLEINPTPLRATVKALFLFQSSFILSGSLTEVSVRCKDVSTTSPTLADLPF